ncbi:hypothetical protein THARTR1_10283 [Trichoderma harzianum]|uniref:ABC transporter domain-containing protein n=1 Tax=Trichoderma harzianum TaxID=5544 RepID=A0A2K0TTH5_TRIHA|nr:hypothetical protein THARTR1_10283 [Trichoderma harzianum]
MNRIFGLRKARMSDQGGEQSLGPNSGGVRITMENVHFQYPTRDRAVFRDLSLTIEQGMFAALVGSSGSGKSSVISLIERFYDVNRGQITWDGQNITQFDVKQYRQAISLVAQESNLIQGTIRENILIGVGDTDVTDEQLYEACRDAGIHDFIAALPNGYDTEIGSKGVGLSGGQAQRISIARALIRNPRLLLLDEATSNLDAESERLVQESLQRVRRGRTMIVVAHRLATVQDADLIFVMGEGRVMERGTHAELVKQRGHYWKMCQSQALQASE